MSRHIRSILAGAVFLLQTISSMALDREVPDIHFSRISIDSGLSQNTIFSIAQDRSGNIWFATYDGVNKFDGYDFTVYQHSMTDTTSIADDITRTICTDSRGRIWVGTSSGLSLYDEELDLFRNWMYKGVPASVNAVWQVSETYLLVAFEDRLSVFDMSRSAFRDDVLPVSMMPLKVTAISGGDGKIYLGTSSGEIHVYETGSNSVYPLRSFRSDNGTRIQAILMGGGDRYLYVGTEGDGMYRIDMVHGDVRHYLHSNSGLSSDYVRALAMDSSKRLWIGTFDNLCIYDSWNDSFTVYNSSPVDPESLSQKSVRCIFRDSQGGMWLGTYFGGANYYHPLKMRFRNIRHIPFSNSLSGNIVSCIVEDADSTLWIGTNDGGMNHYDPGTGKFGWFMQKDLTDGTESYDIKAIYIDRSERKVYVGAHAGGLSVLDRKSGRIRHFTPSDGNPGAADVYAILCRDASSLWVGTLGGLYIFDMQSGKFSLAGAGRNDSAGLSSRIMAMYRDSRDRLWLGGDILSVYDVSSGNIGQCLSSGMRLPGICNVQDFHESSDGTVWIASRTGLYAYSGDRDTTLHFTTGDGLPNNVIYGIEEDSNGNLWLSSNKGLSCLNPDTGRIKTYSASDGLQSDQFNTYSHCRASDGKMYFGGINGITVFYPESLNDNPYSPDPVISSLSLYNRPVRPGDATGLLTKSISMTDRIVLRHDYRSFTLGFVVSNYVSGQNNTFAYKLGGYDNEWYYPDRGVRSASYTNLPPGKYTFLVKSANCDGLWNEAPVSLEIVVKPVWYSTWWALCMFAIVITVFIFLVAKFIWERKTMAARLDLERKEQKSRDDVNQMKMRFFINISHELRTPLTLIVAPLQEMISKTSDRWMRTQLRFIERNTNRILHLVNQLMDYRRAEQGVFKLNVSREDVFSLVQDNFSFYEKLAQHKGLEYSFVSDLEGRKFLVDKKYLDLIVNNLISNAFKYTDKGIITVRLFEKDNNIVLQVSDTGTGIALDKQSRIFERFYQIDSEHIGSGIGLSLVMRLAELHHGHVDVQSTEGVGSTFTVTFPQDESLYAPEEMAGEGADSGNTVYSTNPREMYYIDTEREIGEQSVVADKKYGTILIVEDNEEIRNYIGNGVSSMFEVYLAENGEKALEQLKDHPETDIVITDVMMPVMDGIKLCRSIKQNTNTSHIPVIMLSAKTDVDDQLEAFQTGADDYIPKPFSLQLLMAKANNIIKTRKRLQERFSRTVDVTPESMTFNPLDEEFLKRSIEIIREHMSDETFSTEVFAKEVNMSRSSLYNKLKAITGLSTLDFIRKIRFSEACALLKENKWTVAEVGYKVGFTSPSYFSTSFKKYVGCLPTEFAERYGGHEPAGNTDVSS